MLEHLNKEPVNPKRVVVLGSGGFVGSAAVERLKADGMEVLALARKEIDLLSGGAAAALASELRAGDALVVVSAMAPCKNSSMLVDNVRMMDNVCAALEKSPVGHLVYISSDAVYRDSPDPLTEDSCAEPGSLHGAMHLARELMLDSVHQGPFAILRPSLLYGAADPHNGYGPNQFRRKCIAGETITLFGEGEERRDHVFIDDVAELIARVVRHKSSGVLNVATGAVASFREIAEQVAAHFDVPPEIKSSPRKGPMPHGGYRPFSTSVCRKAFPDFNYTQLSEGLAKAHREAV